MPTTVLRPNAVSSLDGHFSNFSGGGPSDLSDGSGTTGYRSTGETNGAPAVKSYFNTTGLPAGALAPFSNFQCFGWVSVQQPLPVGEFNEADVGLDDGGSESLWNRWNHDGGVDTVTSNNAYALAPFSGVFAPTTVAQVNAVRVIIEGGRNISGGDAGRNYFEAYWKTDHAVQRGVMVGMMLSFLGTLVAVGLHEMPAVSRALFLRSRTLIRPDEYLGAWRELRAPRPVRFFTGWSPCLRPLPF